MYKKVFLFILFFIMLLLPNTYAKENNYTIVSGDLYTINSEICFGDDCFYVIANDGNILRLLAKNNITQEDKPVQSTDAEGISFTDEPYWGETERQDAKYVYNSKSNLYKFVDAYKKTLIEKGVLVENARLVNQEELYLCGVDVITYTWPSSALKCDSNFWGGVAYNNKQIWTSELEQAEYRNSYFGIRPVLEIPVGWFNEENTVYMGGTSFVEASDGVASNNVASIDLTFNDLGQYAKFETIIYNDTDEIMYVNDINVEGLSESYVNVVLDDNSKNEQIEAGGASLVSFYVKTLSEEGAGKNLDDEVKINFLVSNNIVNPDTFSNNFEFLILIVILSIVIVCISNIFKNKKICFLTMIFGFIILGTRAVFADEYLKITVLGNIEYKSLNILETTGTILNDKSADYSNSKDVWAYYDKVKNIYVKSLVNVPKKYFKKFDLTLDDGNRVTAYLVENGDKTVPYDLFIMSNGVVIANEDSSFLFSFPNVEKIEGISNVDFSETTSMQGMFIGNTKLEKADVKSIDMSSAKDVSYMFYDNKKLSVTVKDFDVSNVENMEYMTQNYLNDVIKVNAGNDANLDYSASLDSGNFLYNKSKNEKNPIYYYRGNVDDNNVKFADFCWLIVRTTDTGGIKLLYNGSPDENGYCIKNNNAAVVGSAERFSAFQVHLGAAGYMYGDTIPIKSKKLVSIIDEYVYGNDVTYDASTDTYALIDTISSANWKDDMEKISKKYHYSCFNSTGTCSTVYYIISPDNTMYEYSGNTYISDSYYIEVKSGNKFQDMVDLANKNINNSNAKRVVDEWYANNLISYTNYLEDTVWCNDRTITGGSLSSKDFISYKQSNNYFAISDRITYDYATGFSNLSPSLACTNVDDRFTVDSSKGNGALTYPIALLTADELILIGVTANSNDKYYFNDKCWWTMTPSVIDSDFVYGYRFYSGYTYNGNIHYSSIHSVNINVSGSGYIRPSISLKSGTQFVSGDGSYTNPYVIE